MREIIEKLLDEVDADIKELMLADEVIPEGSLRSTFIETLKNYQLLPDPTGTILMWQELRDRKKHG